MLVNISSNYSTTWCDRQKQMAVSAFGEIVDIGHPVVVTPHHTAREIFWLTQSYLEMVDKMVTEYVDANAIDYESEDFVIAYSLDGDINFVVAMLYLLKERDREVFNTIFDEKGRFVQFRNYEI